MRKDISRSITFSGNQEYANTFVAKACGLFDIFVSNLGNRPQGVFVFPINSKSYIRMVLNGSNGSIHIHAEYDNPQKYIDVEIKNKDIKCHWMKKLYYRKEYNPNTQSFVYTREKYPVLFGGHGFGKIAFGSTYHLFVLSDYIFGEKIAVIDKGTDSMNTSFFEDNVNSGSFPTKSTDYSFLRSTTVDFDFITKRIWAHTGLLAYAFSVYSGLFYFGNYTTASIDELVPAIQGIFNHPTQGELTGFTPALGGYGQLLYRKGKTKFIYHGVDPDNELTDVAMQELLCGLSNTYYGGGDTGGTGTKYHGPTLFIGDANFLQVASNYQDYTGQNSLAYLQGTTTLGSMYSEDHQITYDGNGNPENYYDWYWFSTLNSATVYISAIQEDGSIVNYSGIVASAVSIVGGQEYPVEVQSWPDHHNPYVAIVQQAGCDIRDIGSCIASCMKAARIVGGNRHVVFICDYDYVLHDQFDYNLFVNTGSGFIPLNAAGQDAQSIAAGFAWSVNALAFVHNNDIENHPYNFAIVQANPAAIVVNLLSAFFAVHTDSRTKELRMFHSKNYKWFVLYNAINDLGEDISGVYSFNGSLVARIGDATGIEPVEIDPDENYFLMQDKAYGSISGTFDRLVGFFYDKYHYLEMQSREEDHLKRFVIKNVIQEEIAVLEWGAYSFYETAEDGSFAVISHCSINGISQSTTSGVSVAVNFTDGPFEFETICRRLNYSFSIDVPDGYTLTDPGQDSHAPELASPYYGPPNREPPYGRKEVSICYCYEDVWIDNKWKRKHRHHVMISPASGQGFYKGDQYCQHRPGFFHQRVKNTSIRTLYKRCKQQRDIDPEMTKQVITLLALPNGYFYERITDEVGPVDQNLLISEEYVSEVIKLKQG